MPAITSTITLPNSINYINIKKSINKIEKKFESLYTKLSIRLFLFNYLDQLPENETTSLF